MPRKALLLMLAFLLVFSVVLIFLLSFEPLRVRNLNTGRSYSTIQEAIDASETLDGHEIFVASGTYQEHVTVNKSLSLIGEDPSSTIIDGNGKGKVVYVTADNVEVRSLTIRNGVFGLWLDNSHNSKIIGNTLHDGSNGLRLYYSRNTEITGNHISGYTSYGVKIESSGNSTLRDNSIVDNEFNFGVNGNSLSDFINDIDVSNNVNGKPLRYLINQHNITIDSSTYKEIGYLGLVNSTNIKVKNLNVQNNKQGVLFAFAANSAISNVNAKNNWNGIYVAHSSNVAVNGNNANNNFDYGIKFFNSPRSVASGNNVDNNGWAGVGLFKSPNSTVEGNEANFNTYNLHLVYTNNSVITRNNALTPRARGYSIAVYYSHSNLIYRNSFANRLLHVETGNETRFTPGNSWDNGLEGNYWSLYTGADVDRDGIGDIPYEVGESNTDNHPLMGEFSDFTATLGGKTYSIAIVSNSTVSQFQFSQDDGRISFNAAGEKGTMGFSRVAVPNAFLQDLQRGNLSFLINRELPLLKRKWSDETHMYFYFSYVNLVSESAIGPWLIAVVASIFLTVSVIVVLVLREKHRIRLAEREQPQKDRRNSKARIVSICKK